MTVINHEHTNLYSLLRELRFPRLEPQIGWGDVRFSWGKHGYPGDRYERNGVKPYTWDELVKNHGGEWARVSCNSSVHWIIAHQAPKLVDHRLDGKKIKVEYGCPCTATVHSDQWHSGTCMRVAVEEMPNHNGWGDDERAGTVWLCKMHRNGFNKSKASAEAHKAKWDEQDAATRRENETLQRAEEALEGLRPLLAQLGIHPDTVTASRKDVLLPAEVLELFVANAIELESLKEDLGL